MSSTARVASSVSMGRMVTGTGETPTVVVHRPGAASVVTLSTIATGFTSDGVPAANMVTTRIVAAWASARRAAAAAPAPTDPPALVAMACKLIVAERASASRGGAEEDEAGDVGGVAVERDGVSVMAAGERRPNRAMSSAFSAICGVPNHRATLTEL